MTQARRWLTIAISVALLLALFGCSTAVQEDLSDGADLPIAPIEGAYAPDLTLADLHGEEWTLSTLRGKDVLLNLWATW